MITATDAAQARASKADAERSRAKFANARKAETWYARALRRIAAAIDMIVKGFDIETDPEAVSRIEDALNRYAQILGPWAESVARRMIADVSARDERAWAQLGREIGVGVRHEIQGAPIGTVFRTAMAEQVRLITSIPYEASLRVHEIATGSLYSGDRAAGMVAEIMRSGEVARSRATTIALTETSRAASEITSARAQYVGSPGYIWRTSRDRRVRPLHRKLEGTFHRWDEPPVTGENGERSLPGGIYRCRCYSEVLLPESFRGSSQMAA